MHKLTNLADTILQKADWRQTGNRSGSLATKREIGLVEGISVKKCRLGNV